MSHSCAYCGTNSYLRRLSSVDIDMNLTGYWQCDLQIYWAWTSEEAATYKKVLVTNNIFVEPVSIKPFQDYCLADTPESFQASLCLNGEESWPRGMKTLQWKFSVPYLLRLVPKWQPCLEGRHTPTILQACHGSCLIHYLASKGIFTSFTEITLSNLIV